MSEYGGILSTKQEVDYFAIAFITIFIGIILRYTAESKIKRNVGAFVGLSVIVLFCGIQGIFVYFSVSMTIFWMVLPRSIQATSYRIIFMLILTSRILFSFSSNLFGIRTNDLTVANTFHMFLSLRCISLMHEICESRNHKAKCYSKITPNYIAKEPLIIDAICYLLYPPAICLGPFYTFQTFSDFINMPKNILKSVPFTNEILKRLAIGSFLYIIVWLKIHFLPEISENLEDFGNWKFGTQVLLTVAKTFETSFFLCILWLAGECTCISFGLGAYSVKTLSGKGPKLLNNNFAKTADIKSWNYETISNGKCAYWFTESSVSGVFRNWNTTVQWWLARYIYTNPVLSKHSRFTRLIITQFVNAVWHGSATGYFLTLIGLALLDTLEKWYQEICENFFEKTKKLPFCILKHLCFNIVMFSYVMFPFIGGGLEVTKIVFINGAKPIFLMCVLLLCFPVANIITNKIRQHKISVQHFLQTQSS